MNKELVKQSKIPFSNMKKFLVFLIFSLLLMTCIKDDKKDDDAPLDIEELYYQTMKPEADAVLLSDDPITGFIALAEKYTEMPEVKHTLVTEDGLFIEFENEEVVFWVLSPPYDENGDDENILKSALSPAGMVAKNVTQKRACLINQVVNDDRFVMDTKNLERTGNILKSIGWHVDSIAGRGVSVDFFKKGMTDYDAIFIMTHGVHIDENNETSFAEGVKNNSKIWGTWLCTGEVSKEGDMLSKQGYKGLARGTVKELQKDGTGKEFNYYWISEKFVNNANLSFPSSIIYLTSCSGLKTSALAKAFTDKGAKIVIGWDGINRYGDEAGLFLFYYLAQCRSVEEIRAIANFPRTDTYYKSNLVFYPGTATDYCFCAPPPAPVTLDATNILADRATLRGKIPRYGGVGITERGFAITPANEPGNWKNFKDEKFNPATYSSDTDTEYSVVFQGFQSGVEYHFKAYVVASGKTYYAEEKTFKTLGTVGTITMTLAEQPQLTRNSVSFSMTCSGKFTIDWGDGTTHSNPLSSYSHSYSTPQTYTITITGENITSLRIVGNFYPITHLDVSNNTALKSLECSVNKLTSLDVSKNTALIYLRCENNQLTSLNVNGATALTDLDCSYNRLTSLNVSGLNALAFLSCSDNYMTAATLNSLFHTLNSTTAGKTIVISYNGPNRDGTGTSGCDRSIAISKGWTVSNY